VALANATTGPYPSTLCPLWAASALCVSVTALFDKSLMVVAGVVVGSVSLFAPTLMPSPSRSPPTV